MTMSANRRPTSKCGISGRVLAGLTLIGLLGVYGIADSRWQLTAVAIGGSAMCLAAFLYVGQLLPRYHTMRLLIVSYALQLVALTAITVLGLPLSPPGHPFEINAAEAPFRVMLAVLTVPAGALTAAVAWWSVSRWARRPEKKPSLSDIAKPRRVYLV